MNTPFDDSLKQDFDTLQSTSDSGHSTLTEAPIFGQDSHASSAFDPHSFAQTYQPDHFSQENHWDNDFLGGHAHHVESSISDSGMGLYSHQ
ncbi:MAG: hypothetical protein BWK79_11840, partial [Beggiatoa sp. IS2]